MYQPFAASYGGGEYLYNMRRGRIVLAPRNGLSLAAASIA
jgi:hypothetical protein